ncbi:MAG: hypothetical protein ACJ8F7_08860 [Gemmataceae bacterium]
MNLIIFAGLLGLALAAPALAQPAGPLTYSLTVHPAGPPTPALKYTLLPELKDVTKGNALLRYYKAYSTEWWASINRQPPKWHEAASDAQTAPLVKMPADYAFVKTWKMLNEVDRGARMDHCDWESLEDLKRDGFAYLLPDVQGMRSNAMWLALRARYELADGDIDRCIYTLQTGFALSKHVGEGPTLVHMLVGVAISQVMTRQLDELVQHPKCPNLYWALARLPRPYVDLRRPFQAEMMVSATIFPEIDELRRGPIPLDQAQKYLDEFVQRCKLWGIANLSPQELTVQALAIYPKAKAALVQAGRPQAEVDAMPVPQVLLLHSAEEFFRQRDELFKWAPLPFPEAYSGMVKMSREIRAAKARGDILPPAADLAPAVEKVMQANMRADRRFAMLRVVEAVRLYAADHDGRPPAKLADVTDVPIPTDPGTGKPFEYAVKGDHATITGPDPTGETPTLGMVYNVTLKK